MSKIYQRGLEILAGGIAAAGLATLLSDISINAHAQTLDGQIDKTQVAAQARTPLDEYLRLFNETNTLLWQDGQEIYQNSNSNFELYVVRDGGYTERATGRSKMAGLRMGYSAYRIAVKDGNFVFEFTEDISNSAKRSYDTVAWVLDDKFNVKSFYRKSSHNTSDEVDASDRDTLPLGNMTPGDKKDFDQLGAQLEKFLSGIRLYNSIRMYR